VAKLTNKQKHEIRKALDYLERGLGKLSRENGFILCKIDSIPTTTLHFMPNGNLAENIAKCLYPILWEGSGTTIASHAIDVLKRLLANEQPEQNDVQNLTKL
jgi:hypothetical protein